MENKKDLPITITVLIRYAGGMLRPEVATEVEKQLAGNEMLRLQYEGILQLVQNHPDEDPEELLERMAANATSRIGSVRQKEGQRKKMHSMRRWLLAAALLMIVITTGIVILYRNTHSASALAQQMIGEKKVSAFENATRGAIQAGNVIKWKAEFAKDNFKAVISILEKEQDKSPEEVFYLAVSYLKRSPSQPEKAEPLLSTIVNQETEFTSDGWLYLALTQTLLNQNEQAIGSLHHIEQTAQVKELADRLRK